MSESVERDECRETSKAREGMFRVSVSRVTECSVERSEELGPR